MTIKKLTKIGNAYGLIIDKAYLKLLGLDHTAQFEIKVYKDTMIITNIAKEENEKTIKE